MSARAVIFDMDGLLIDSERVILDCWRETAVAQSLDLEDSLWLSMVGLHDKGCAELLNGLLGAERAERLTFECKRRYDLLVEDGLPLKAGARELLQDLFDLGVPLAVATSTRGERARIKLARSGIDGYFAHVVTSSDVTHAKPAPDLYLLAAQRLEVPPAECVALEDSEFGVRAAAAAGIRVIQVPDMVPATDLSRSLAPVVESLPLARPQLESWLQISLKEPQSA
ncbi:HAD family phosphatase [Pseudoxanthomonas sp. CF125]|uniref:HAD family hydrolase n=1 Tax=Pseudoxanthomonas sp. CF125 TaxID=1855303 RepID=UPI000887D31F|nr:HAD family phosphatase [Pseudoxanthomonas sp. CF125]SDQ78555.1 haloacid dehalogenase superfamily, subfamily IA, variant 3 with third motif having DD or ED [Pseudoxanthomonas sp. CF125]